MNQAGLIIGIDATNLRIGGGVTHLTELLTHADPAQFNISQIVVWGCLESLACLPDHPWLKKISIGSVNKAYLRRVLWQRLMLSRAVKQEKCDLLFVPGGNYIGSFSPMVTMSRNMLPFQWQELSRYGISWMSFRLVILRQVQAYSFRAAAGMIFLTQYACEVVGKASGTLTGKSVVIPHGLSTRFGHAPKSQHPVDTYSEAKPFRLLYVSIVDVYKHQWQVVDAVNILRQEGYPVELELIGPAYKPSLKKLVGSIERSAEQGAWVRYRGNVPYAQLSDCYANADLGIFASSCENMPNILLETMAAGLPVACSKLGPMPEVLGDAGLYFDPEDPVDIANTLRQYLTSPELRTEKSRASFMRVQQYSWSRCAEQTLAFLAEIATQRRC
jgi:glycosyltransferase involved in cell wall biosynthesis